MSIFTEMVRGSSTASRLFALLETGHIANAIGGIELSAAKDAFARIDTAKDKRGQVQICIGHLNSAYSAFAHIVEDAGFLDRTLLSRTITLEDAQKKGCFVLCLRAICFAYLGEVVHCEQDLRSATRFQSKEIKNGAQIYWIASSSFNPIAALDLSYAGIRDIFRGEEDDTFHIGSELINELERKLLPNKQLSQS